MADTFTRLYVHIIFATAQRIAFIHSEHKEELHKYISGIIKNKGGKLLAINSMPDHIHILIGFKPDISISNLVKEIKQSSAIMINEKKWGSIKFSWQKGYGAFSYSHSQLDNVIAYINNQEEHHRKYCFRDEYIKFLKIYNIDFDIRYLPVEINV